MKAVIAKVRQLAPAVALVVAAFLCVPSNQVAERLSVISHDHQKIEEMVRRAAQSDVALSGLEPILDSVHGRVRAAGRVASTVAALMGVLTLFGTLAYSLLSTSARWIRFTALGLVLILEFRAFLWVVT